MKRDDEVSRILRDFMDNASPGEIDELERLLKQRENRRRYTVPDSAEMARKLSAQIHQQMGLTGANIKHMARELVMKMAREHKPDIRPDELDALVEQMVPTGAQQGGRQAVNLPPEMIKSMVVQFILYSQGQMQQSEIERMPAGWIEKYWNAFPADVRKLVSVYIKGGIDKRSFWKRIKEALGS